MLSDNVCVLFKEAALAHGIPLPDRPLTFDHFLRWGKGSRYSAKVLGDDGIYIHDFVTGEDIYRFSDQSESLSSEQMQARQRKIEAARREAEADHQRRYEEAANCAEALWNSLVESGQSEYLHNKQAQMHGIRFGQGFIAVPVRDISGKRWSVQRIYDNAYCPEHLKQQGRNKDFLKGGRVNGCFHSIGELAGATEAYLCEGYATGSTLHQATGKTVIISFFAGNIAPVALAIRKAYPLLSLTIAADNDCWKPENGNPGKEKAEEAAKRYGCRMALPEFSDQIKEHLPTDWNDLHCLAGIEEVRRQISMSAMRKVLLAHTLHDFLNLEIPPRENILAPVIPTQGLVMLYAIRGAGKTYVSLTVALAVAAGTAMLGGRWVADKPRRVLYLDGEMPATVLQNRFNSLTVGLGKELPVPDYLSIITPDMQEIGIPDLGTSEGQETIEQHLDGVELLILDNLSALVRNGRENEAESWMSIQGWLLSLRRRGISVLLVHHANKSGAQRGTSKKEDLLDTVIALKRPDDYDPQHGAQFSVHYEKARGFQGDEAKPFEARLFADGKGLRWEVKDVENSQLERALALQAEGLTQRQIAQEMDCNVTKVNRLLKRAKTEAR